MTQWKRDTRLENVRTFGDFHIYSEVNPDRETAHVVQFPDGREIRVLPDERSTGRSRATALREGVEALADRSDVLGGAEGLLVDSYDARVWFTGWLAMRGLVWEGVTVDLRDVSIEEWLAEWLEAGGSAEQLLHDLDVDGWTPPQRKGET